MVPAAALVATAAADAVDAVLAGGVAAAPSRRGRGPALPPVRPVATPPANETPIPPLLREDEPSFLDVPHGGFIEPILVRYWLAVSPYSEHVPRDAPSRVRMGEGGRTPIHVHREVGR